MNLAHVAFFVVVGLLVVGVLFDILRGVIYLAKHG